jgi:DmsE family decaheme c-type cytochrome
MAAATLLTVALGGAQVKPGAPAPAPTDNKPAQYVGSDTCQGCHEDIFAAFQKNPHHEVETSKKYKFDTKACESCHGPGSKHAESAEAADIKNPAKLKPAAADRTCLGCHLNRPTQVGRINGSHAKNEVACVACHSVHKNGPNGLVARKAADVNQLCAGCHGDIWASFQQPFRHRLPEGAMSCVDCHNPHGSFLPHNVQTAQANEPGCFKCHGNKAGPFAFEHAPVRLDGCPACHMPHGSPNARMLTRSEVRFVCLECHSNLPTPTAAANAALGSVAPASHNLFSPQIRGCTVCHQQVHGSYVDRGLLR